MNLVERDGPPQPHTRCNAMGDDQAAGNTMNEFDGQRPHHGEVDKQSFSECNTGHVKALNTIDVSHHTKTY